MVEKAINMIDVAEGRKVEWKGPDCAKNGADRVVDGVSIQTKYYSSASGSVDAAFDSKTGLYRYVNQDGSPMQLEVPSDQYEAALSRFRAKISAGKVEGVTDPNQAEAILRKGKYTYQQAVNLTKAGTIESLKYDAGTGVVTCMSAFGFSFVAATFMAYRSTGDLSKSIQAGAVAGTQVFGMSFIQHMLASQLSRTTVADAMLVPSQMIVEGMGTKATQAVVNGLRAIAGKQAIYGAAAAKQLAKTLRGNAVTAAITLAVFSVPQAYNLVANKISRAQFAKNIAVLAGGVAAGAGGAIAAGVAAGKVGAIIGTEVTPVVGTVVGAVGGFVGGTVGSAALGALGGVVKEDDAVVIGRLFNAMIAVLVSEYLLCEKEIDALVNLLNEIDQKELKKLIERVHGAGSQEREIREFLCPIFDEVASKREGFSLPDSDEIAKAIEGLA